MEYELAIARGHKDLVKYFFYQGERQEEFPEWFETSLVDEKNGEIEFTVKDVNFNGKSNVFILKLEDVAVYSPYKNLVHIMSYMDFANTYNRVED